MKKNRRLWHLTVIVLLFSATSCKERYDQAAPSETSWAVTEQINLSLEHFQAGDFEKSVDACKKALELDPDNANAYNNMCAAYNKLHRWDDAISACNSALASDPGFGRAENNLRWAEEGKAKG